MAGSGFLTLALLVAAAVTACGMRPPVYRATAKLVVQRVGTSPNPGTDDVAFFETQTGILRTQVILRRVQQRLRKTPLEIAEQLINIEATRAGQSDILLVSVESRSQEFAQEFANALVDEYLKFREEQRAQSQESALLMLTREINRLSEELKAGDARIIAYLKEHSGEPGAAIELQAMHEDRERIKELHETLLRKLLSIDVSSQFDTRAVTLLEPAVVTEKSRRWPWR